MVFPPLTLPMFLLTPYPHNSLFFFFLSDKKPNETKDLKIKPKAHLQNNNNKKSKQENK